MLTSEKIMKKKHRDNNYFKKPASAQDIIPIDAAYPDGMFLSNGKLYSRSFRISDINYSGQSEEQQESVIRRLRAAIRGCTAGEISQFTIINRRQNEDSITRLFYPTDDCDNRGLRNELNEVIRSKSGRGTGLIQELFFTASVDRPTPKAASLYFEQIDSEIGAQFGSLGSSFTAMPLSERLRLLHDFYRPGDENYWQFDLADKQKKNHSVKDSIAPMSIKFLPDRFEMGGKFGRVLAMTDYAGNIDDRTLAKLSICQNVEDILKSATGVSMIENSEFVVMLKQAAINAAALAKMYHISPNQMQYFTNVEPGKGLIKIGGVLVPFDSRIPKGTHLYNLCNTDRDGKWQKKGA